jgi:hypothetical protein
MPDSTEFISGRKNPKAGLWKEQGAETAMERKIPRETRETPEQKNMEVSKQLLKQQSVAHAILSMLGHPRPTSRSEACVSIATCNNERSVLITLANCAADQNRNVIAFVLDETDRVAAVNVMRTDSHCRMVIVNCAFWISKSGRAAILVSNRGRTAFRLIGNELVEKNLRRLPDARGYDRAERVLAILADQMATDLSTNCQVLRLAAHPD